ncbi:hypothetical protein [Microbacterium sp. LWH13-1.2]
MDHPVSDAEATSRRSTRDDGIHRFALASTPMIPPANSDTVV